ncbi:unnamed protein product [Cercospora beticola]|nr:unnamed protein product [Cercospora beticola]
MDKMFLAMQRHCCWSRHAYVRSCSDFTRSSSIGPSIVFPFANAQSKTVLAQNGSNSRTPLHSPSILRWSQHPQLRNSQRWTTKNSRSSQHRLADRPWPICRCNSRIASRKWRLALLNPQTNTSHLDVRLSFRTPEGHGIYVHYDGMMQVDEACLAAILNKDAKTTQYGDHELFSTPIMETSDESKKWIESSSWVAEGRWVVEDGKVAIEYEVYRVRPTKK